MRLFPTVAAMTVALSLVALPATAAGTTSPVSVVPAALFPATSGISYKAVIEAVGGTRPYTFSVVAEGLPKGLSLSSEGMIAGVPDAAPGPFRFAVQARDVTGTTGMAWFNLTLATPVVVITSVALPGARVGQIYRHALRASGGSLPYTYRLARGSLPAGLRLASTGLIVGSPKAFGVRLFTVQVIDAHDIRGSQSFRLVVHKARKTVRRAS